MPLKSEAFVAVCLLPWCVPLAVAGEVHGRIVELHSGKRVEEATIVLASLSRGNSSITVKANNSGEFSFTGITPGRYRIDVSKQGYAAAVSLLTVSGDAAVVFRLAKEGVISGRVTTDAGVPVPGASVFPLFRAPGSSSLTRLHRDIVTRTDDRGFYRLYGLMPGDYGIGVSYSGIEVVRASGAEVISEHEARPPLLVASGEEHDNVNIVVSAGLGHSIEGRIDPMEDDGAALVTLVLRDHPDIAVERTLTDRSGRFRFSQVQMGSYEVLAIGPSAPSLNGGLGGLIGRNPRFGRAEVSVGEQDVQDVSITMRSGESISFSLRESATAGKDVLPAFRCGSLP